MEKHLSRRDVLRLIAGTTAGVVMAGCGATPTPTPPPAKPAAPAAAAPTTAPVVAKKVTLTVVAPPNTPSFLQGEDENNNEIIKFLRQKTGYDIRWIILPSDSPWEKLNLLMSSNEPPDIMNLTAGTVFGQYLTQGILAPIDQYVKNAPNLQKLVPKDLWSATTYDGKIYAVPVPQNQNIAGTNGVYARKDWIKELGFAEPGTIDEYYTVLKALKDKKNVIPLTHVGSGTWNGIAHGFAGAYGLGVPWKVKDNKIVCAYVEPEAKEYLAWMNKLYTDGLLDKEFPINKSGTVQEKLVANQAASSVVNWSTAFTIDKPFKEKNPNGDSNFIAPPKGPRGEWGITRNAPVRSFLAVSGKSKFIPEAVNFLNTCMQDDIYYFVSYGTEGVTYERKGGEIVLLPEYQKRQWQIFYILVDTQEAFAIRLRDKGYVPWSSQTVKWSTLDPIEGFAPPMTDVIGFPNDITTGEYFVKFMAGDMPLSKFDEFVTAWKAKGGEKATAALNKWYAETNKKT